MAHLASGGRFLLSFNEACESGYSALEDTTVDLRFYIQWILVVTPWLM